jgi:hypothetical protein
VDRGVRCPFCREYVEEYVALHEQRCAILHAHGRVFCHSADTSQAAKVLSLLRLQELSLLTCGEQF